MNTLKSYKEGLLVLNWKEERCFSCNNTSELIAVFPDNAILCEHCFEACCLVEQICEDINSSL